MNPRPCRCRCACNDAGPLAVAELRRRAADYVATLTDGETIDDDVGGTDATHVSPFRDYLAQALADAGFRMTVTLVRGRVVTTVHRAPGIVLAPPTQEAST